MPPCLTRRARRMETGGRTFAQYIGHSRATPYIKSFSMGAGTDGGPFLRTKFPTKNFQAEQTEQNGTEKKRTETNQTNRTGNLKKANRTNQTNHLKKGGRLGP